MSTHAVTTIFEDTADGDLPLISYYVHYDGYPEGYGQELFEFLNDMKIVNGLNLNAVPGGQDIKERLKTNRKARKYLKVANGMECLAAQLIAHFKTGPGNVYIVPTNTDHDEEYFYDIKWVNDELNITAYNYETEIFNGSVKEFGEFCNKVAKFIESGIYNA